MRKEKRERKKLGATKKKIMFIEAARALGKERAREREREREGGKDERKSKKESKKKEKNAFLVSFLLPRAKLPSN